VVHSVIVPLLGPLRPLGLLEAHSTNPRPFLAEDVDFVLILAHQLSGALQRISLTQQSRDHKMRRAEQMMAIGQVAAGVAHELRNPLTSIKGLVQVNLREAKRQGLPSDDLAVIEHEIRRMERTLQTFLDFARPPQPDRKPLLLNDVVRRVFALVTGRAGKQGVTLRPELRPDVTVHADQDQMQQLVLNLVLNALDAMPEGGTLEVNVAEALDRQVELTVRDTGPGIAPHILPKVFETFVSSKETGVGLGLPVSQRIAEDHGGTLSAYNLPGGGACFVLRLPAVA
jgi:two-component system sensor histidine kinase HydH